MDQEAAGSGVRAGCRSAHPSQWWGGPSCHPRRLLPQVSHPSAFPTPAPLTPTSTRKGKWAKPVETNLKGTLALRGVQQEGVLGSRSSGQRTRETGSRPSTDQRQTHRCGIPCKKRRSWPRAPRTWGGETDTSKASPVSHGIHKTGHKDLRVTENKYKILEDHIAYFITLR